MDFLVLITALVLIFNALYFGLIRPILKKSPNNKLKNSGIDNSKSNPNSNFDVGTEAGKVKSSTQKQYSYEMIPAIMTPAEAKYFKHLTGCLDNRTIVFTKVRLLDVFKPSESKESFGAMKKISSKHVDFLICCSDSFKPLFAIELDDSSHRQVAAQKRDIFVNELFESCGLKLFRVECASNYSSEITKKLLSDHVPSLDNMHFTECAANR